MFKKLMLAISISSLILTTGNALAEDKTAKIIDQAKYTVIAKFIVKDDQVKRFLSEMKKNETASRKEEGVIAYRVYRSATEKNVFFNLEAFTNKEAFDFHLATPHVKKLISELEDGMLDGEVKVDIVERF